MFLSAASYWSDWKTLKAALSSTSDQRDINKNLLGPAANVIFLPIILMWSGSLVMFLPLTLAWDSSGQFGDSFNVLNSLLSGLALGAIGLSLFLQHSDLKRSLDEMQQTSQAMREQAKYLQFERDMNIREFAATFQSLPLKDARTSAYILRPAFFKDAEFRAVLANQWVSADAIELPEKWIEFIVDSNIGRIPEDQVRNAGNHTWHLSDLIEYYSTLYQHCSSLDPNSREITAKRLGDKYIWAYWRGMLLLLAFEVARLYEEKVTLQERGQFPLPHWLLDLVEFDRWVMPCHYQPNLHPRERGYTDQPIEFDYELLVRAAGVQKDGLPPVAFGNR